jgi:hypothetical protein
MRFSLKKNPHGFLKIFDSIMTNHCPICSSHLNFDNQRDSVYISCTHSLEHFEVSGFKDLGSDKLVLVYLNSSNEGIVDGHILKEFQNIIYRKLYSKEI